jgi:hypothetical protein
MEVIPTISAALTRDFRFPSERRIAELRSLPYAEYLQTAEWRGRRDERIRLASFRCERCQAKRDLQVHHVRYERLGAELDTDLEVLCRTCHEGHHFDESRQQHIGIYVKLVSDVLRGGSITTISDLSAEVRERCIVLGIPFRADRVNPALVALGSNRLPAIVVRPRSSPAALVAPPGGEIGRGEATEILRRLGIVVPVRSMAPAPAARMADHAWPAEYIAS